MGFNKKCGGRPLGVMAAIVCGGVALGCGLPSCETTLTTFNPCGTIFGFCEPEDVYTLFADIPDYGYDPTCSIPYYGLDPEHDGTVGTCATTETYPHTPGPRPEPDD